MKFKIQQLVEKEIDVKYVKIIAPMYYEDEDVPYDFPNRIDNSVTLVIEIDNGKIIDFPVEYTGSLSTKLTDGGSYYLLDEKMNVLYSLEPDYVPNKLIPEHDGCGDYIDLKIANAHVTNWYKNPSIVDFVKQYKENEDF
jgi:hypothetical protein